jgi:hypothetical protein
MDRTRFYGERGIITFDQGLVLRYEYQCDDDCDWHQYVLLADGTWHEYRGFDVLPENAMKVDEF